MAKYLPSSYSVLDTAALQLQANLSSKDERGAHPKNWPAASSLYEPVSVPADAFSNAAIAAAMGAKRNADASTASALTRRTAAVAKCGLQSTYTKLAALQQKLTDATVALAKAEADQKSLETLQTLSAITVDLMKDLVKFSKDGAAGVTKSVTDVIAKADAAIQANPTNDELKTYLAALKAAAAMYKGVTDDLKGKIPASVSASAEAAEAAGAWVQAPAQAADALVTQLKADKSAAAAASELLENRLKAIFTAAGTLANSTISPMQVRDLYLAIYRQWCKDEEAATTTAGKADACSMGKHASPTLQVRIGTATAAAVDALPAGIIQSDVGLAIVPLADYHALLTAGLFDPEDVAKYLAAGALTVTEADFPGLAPGKNLTALKSASDEHKSNTTKSEDLARSVSRISTVPAFQQEMQYAQEAEIMSQYNTAAVSFTKSKTVADYDRLSAADAAAFTSFAKGNYADALRKAMAVLADDLSTTNPDVVLNNQNKGSGDDLDTRVANVQAVLAMLRAGSPAVAATATAAAVEARFADADYDGEFIERFSLAARVLHPASAQQVAAAQGAAAQAVFNADLAAANLEIKASVNKSLAAAGAVAKARKEYAELFNNGTPAGTRINTRSAPALGATVSNLPTAALNAALGFAIETYDAAVATRVSSTATASEKLAAKAITDSVTLVAAANQTSTALLRLCVEEWLNTRA
jgi:hypothetical protein